MHTGFCVPRLFHAVVGWLEIAATRAEWLDQATCSSNWCVESGTRKMLCSVEFDLRPFALVEWVVDPGYFVRAELNKGVLDS